MSYARKVRRRRQRDWERQVVTATSAIRGCSCRPDVEHVTRDGLRHLNIYHSVECTADTERGPMFAVRPGHRQTPEEFAKDVHRVLEAITTGRKTDQ